METRIERDSMGTLEVPADRLWGAQTARAILNFPISGRGIGREMIRALGVIKGAAAQVNADLGLLDPALADAIRRAAAEVTSGSLDDHFPVDVFQTGSGTSSNMNANEVIANRANVLLGGTPGARHPVHPNDHVNLGQSSNDVFPAAIHLAAVTGVETALLPALRNMRDALEGLGERFDDVVKIGRTHLQDATPVRLGQELRGWSSQVRHGIRHVEDALPHLRELPLGGTAVGTGINTHPQFGRHMAAALSAAVGGTFIEAEDHFEAQGARDAAVQMSGALKTVATGLLKIANDIRWLGSGPNLGLGELRIPPVQPGSSIMPGKTNPVMAEALIMVCAQVIGNDTAITLGGAFGNFELNVMMPLIGDNLLEQIRLLANASDGFRTRLLVDLEVNRDHIAARNEASLALATALAPHIGYDAAAEIARESRATGRTIREIAMERKVLPPDVLEQVLNLRRQTGPGSS